MQAVVLRTATAASPHVSAGSKWVALLSGLGLLLLIYLATMIRTSYRNPWKLVEGADGAASTSKFQWFLWLIVILFSYTALWVLRAEQNNFAALSEIPVNLLTVLGFSTGTAAAAKGITSGYVQNGRVAKAPPPPKVAAGPAPAGPAPAGPAPAGPAPAVAAPAPGDAIVGNGGILQDDSGMPELAKIQMVGFTFIAIGVFLITVIHQIATGNTTVGLPNIDSSLMVLMGISQGGYLGKKLVTFSPQTLYAPTPASGAPGTPITLPGVSLGSQPGQLTMDGVPIPVTSWSANSIQFPVPVDDPATNAPWAGLPRVVQLVAMVGGQPSNSVPFTATAPPARST
jgi:hypothetical protein